MLQEMAGGGGKFKKASGKMSTIAATDLKSFGMSYT